jgi:hypothetical protein
MPTHKLQGHRGSQEDQGMNPLTSGQSQTGLGSLKDRGPGFRGHGLLQEMELPGGIIRVLLDTPLGKLQIIGLLPGFPLPIRLPEMVDHDPGIQHPKTSRLEIGFQHFVDPPLKLQVRITSAQSHRLAIGIMAEV